MTTHTPGPWNLVWWGNEKYPYPLTILADNDGVWITRDGSISNPADGPLIAAAPDLLAIAKRILERGYVSECIEEERADYQSLFAAVAKAEGRA